MVIKTISGKVIIDKPGIDTVKKLVEYCVAKNVFLTRADLEGAVLVGATLKEAYLVEANLRGSNLRGVNFIGANLTGANLVGTNLIGANFEEAYLREANFREANLREANLGGAYLKDVKFTDTILTDTCLDPNNEPNALCKEFQKTENGLCIGYRTKNSEVINPDFKYEIGKIYKAPVFSTCTTECHPGLYVKLYREAGDITVYFHKEDLHKAGNKYRVKRFIVVEAG